jgi:urocanate reductase
MTSNIAKSNWSSAAASRRQFVGAAGIAGIIGTAIAASGLAHSASAGEMQSSRDTAWDDEHEVIVCGGGGSGLVAAYAALKAGANDVVVYEKGEECGGTTAMCAGNLQAGGTAWQKEAGIDDSPENFTACLLALGEGCLDEGLVKSLAEGMPDDMQWLADELGITYTGLYSAYPVPYQPEGTLVTRTHIITDANDETKTGGAVLIAKLLAAIEAAGGQIETGTEVSSLVLEEGAVTGVMTTDGRRHHAKGVVLAMSGIEHDERLARGYSHEMNWALTTQVLASSANDTGDGIRMGLASGAQGVFFGGAGLLFPLSAYAADSSEEIPYIAVNQAGVRFFREDTTYGYYSREIFREATRMGGADGCVWIVLDKKMESNLQCAWSNEDVRNDAISDGSLLSADTVEDLAASMGVDPDVLSDTLEMYNIDAKAGEDTRFGRVKQLVPLDEAPFYAWKASLTYISTIGGLLIDENAKVKNVEGETIDGLYAAGGNSAGWNGPVYAGSGLFLDGCVHWGRLAGESAAVAR